MDHRKIEEVYNFIERNVHPDSKTESHTTFTIEIDNQITTVEIDDNFLNDTDIKDIKNKLTKLDLSQLISQSDSKTIRILKDEILYLK